MELLITLGLLAAFMGAVQDTLLVTLRTVHSQSTREQLKQELSAALDRLTRAAGVADNIDRAEDDHFQFDTPSLNNVEFEYDGSADTLDYDDGDSPSRTILRRLTALDFNYTDCTGTAYDSGDVDGDDEDFLRVVRLTATASSGTETVAAASAAFMRGAVGLEDDEDDCDGA